MKGVRFYRDANGGRARSNPHKWRKDFPDGCNGIAVLHENVGPSGCAECLANVFDGSGDGPYATTSVAWQYLQADCKRISEAEARERYPQLMARLDD